MAASENKPRRDEYQYQTLRALNNLLFIFPMLVLFQVATFFYGHHLLAPIHLNRLLEHFGAPAAHLPALLIVVTLLLQHLLHHDPWEVRPYVLAGMFGESMLWATPLIGMVLLTHRAIPFQAVMTGSSQVDYWLQHLMLAVGAGIYEEFLFRLIAISIILLVFVDIFELKRDPVTVAAVLISAVAFSLYHLSQDQLTNSSQFPWGPFIFRAMAGVYLGGLFIFRGYGIAVGAHVFYNLYAAAVSQ